MTDRTFFMYAPTVTVTTRHRHRKPSLAKAIAALELMQGNDDE
jgi:hypothetical protein